MSFLLCFYPSPSFFMFPVLPPALLVFSLSISDPLPPPPPPLFTFLPLTLSLSMSLSPLSFSPTVCSSFPLSFSFSFCLHCCLVSLLSVSVWRPEPPWWEDECVEGSRVAPLAWANWPAIGRRAWHCRATVNAAGLMEDAHWCPLLTVCPPLPHAICHRDTKQLKRSAGSGKVQALVRQTGSFLTGC